MWAAKSLAFLRKGYGGCYLCLSSGQFAEDITLGTHKTYGHSSSILLLAEIGACVY